MAAKINKYVSLNKLSSKVYEYKCFALTVIATDVNNIFLIYDLCIMFVLYSQSVFWIRFNVRVEMKCQ